MNVLALNSGSSSLKFGSYRVRGEEVVCLADGEFEEIGSSNAVVHATEETGRTLAHETSAIADSGAAVARIASLIASGKMEVPNAIGHRIVHGGPGLRKHCLIDGSVLQQLQQASVFAPLHAPAELALVGYAMAHFPGTPQVACIDTCFHAGMPPVASTLALPAAIRAAGIERYGFHGLSCESIVRALGRTLPERLIIAHLGNGASVTAVRKGLSIDTTMGLTPTGGLIMGTRSGDLDPGVLIHLMRTMKLDAAAMDHLINHRSGLLGISGIGSDMRVLHAAARSHPEAALAVDMFCYGAAQHTAAMYIALGGVDQLVFTGGIGENDVLVRAGICAHLSCLGVHLDMARNQRGQGRISDDAAKTAVSVLPSGEDTQIARHTERLSHPQH